MSKKSAWDKAFKTMRDIDAGKYNLEKPEPEPSKDRLPVLNYDEIKTSALITILEQWEFKTSYTGQAYNIMHHINEKQSVKKVLFSCKALEKLEPKLSYVLKYLGKIDRAHQFIIKEVVL